MSLQPQPRDLLKIMNDVLSCIPATHITESTYLHIRFQQIIHAYSAMPKDSYPLAWHEAALALNQTLGDPDTDWKLKIVGVFSGKLVLEKSLRKGHPDDLLTPEQKEYWDKHRKKDQLDDPFDSVSDISTKPEHKWAKAKRKLTVRIKGKLDD